MKTKIIWFTKPENFDRSWLSSDELKNFLSEYFFKQIHFFMLVGRYLYSNLY